MKATKIEKGFFGMCSVIIAVIFVFCGFLAIFSFKTYFKESTIHVSVTDKQVKRSNEDDIYLVYGLTDDGDTYVASIEDDLIHLKFNSSDIFAGIQVGHSYTFQTYGIRVPIFSMYPNIQSYKED